MSVGLGDDENIFKWELMIIGPPDTLYEGGFFNCKLEFPNDFPNSPPVMTFLSPMWHPNGIISESIILFSLRSAEFLSISVHTDGKVCISILHPPGEDAFNELVSIIHIFYNSDYISNYMCRKVLLNDGGRSLG